MKKTPTPIVKGYKVTDANMQCRGFQYELNKAYNHKGKVSPCNSGFHFCALLVDCFEYYNFDPANRVFEVEASGEVVTHNDKYCSDNITFLRELTWIEVLTLVNTGKDNTGRRNSGNRNSGYSNSGNSNSGNRNSGDSNSGYRNSGDSNSGNWNSGNRNSGDSNSGYWNSGNRNSGDSNSGNWNSGNRNSGDSNSGYRNSGAFCLNPDPKLILFDRESSMTVKEWEQHPVCQLMYSIEPTIWVPMSIMSDEEKAAHPKYETTEGYLKTITMQEAWANFWHNLADNKKDMFYSLENFDKKTFETITGLKITLPKKK